MPDNRQIKIKTPLGEDDLRIIGVHGSEELGRLFQYDLDLYSKDEEINIDNVLGENVTVSLELEDGSFRYLNGFVSRFSQVGRTEGGYATYEAILRPWFWFLTRTSDCRIFQEKTVPDIIKEVFGDNGFSDFEDSLSGSYRTWEYCVQYRETDFNFLSRLMEQEGIYYFFKHEDGKHMLVLADSYSSHEAINGNSSLRCYLPGLAAYSGSDAIVSDWILSREVQPGAYALCDYDFKKPKTELRVNSPIPREHAAAEYEIFDYPGEFVEKPDGDQYSQSRIEELHVQFEQVSAQTDARTMACGGLFELTDHPRADQNREYLINTTRIELSSGELSSGSGTADAIYQCAFSALESKTPYRAARVTPKPIVQGPQTAVVVGPSGEEIYPDEYGRIKVQFHWDRYGQMDENSSCWIRVAQYWAGSGWGAQYIPRVGQEVMVEFLEGDPDRPIITGRVYNADNMPPYSLPDNKTQSGLKSRSTKGGAENNFNEIRFEDKKGEEQLSIQAEKDEKILVKNSKNENVGADESVTIGANQTITVGKDRTDTVNNSETRTVQKDRSRTVGGSETISVGMARTHSVGINESINIGAAQEVVIGGMQVVEIGAMQNIDVGFNQSMSIGRNQNVEVGENRVVDVGSDDELKVAKNLVIDVGVSVTLKCGKASISMDNDGTITIKGKDLTLDGSGKIGIKATGDVKVNGSKVQVN